MKKPKASSAGWRILKGEEGTLLPQSALDAFKERDIWCSGMSYGGPGKPMVTWRDASWVQAMYKGEDPETATEWVIVTDNGGYYKVQAKYMIWVSTGGAYARWSWHFLNKSMRAIRAGERVPDDPNYQT